MFPTILGVADDELLDLLELVYSEQTPGVVTMLAGLFPEASAISGILDGQIGSVKPLVGMESGKRLLAGGDEVLGIAAIVFGDLIQLLVELRELGRLGHVGAVHEKGRLVGRIALVEEKLEAKVYEGLVQEQSPAGQAVASMAGKLGTALGVVSLESGEDLVMAEQDFSRLGGLGFPGADDGVVILGGADGNRVVDIIADGPKLDVQLFLKLDSGGLLRSASLGNLVLLGQQIVNGLALLLPRRDVCLDRLELGADLGRCIECRSMDFPELDDLVDYFGRRTALHLALSNLFGVAATRRDEVQDVEHLESCPSTLVCEFLVELKGKKDNRAGRGCLRPNWLDTNNEN